MPSLFENLRDTNRRLTFWLDRVTGKPGQPLMPTPEEMGALLSELLRAGAVLRAQPGPAIESDPAVGRELQNYRCHVERLRDLLPSIHDQLLAERARLESERARMRSAVQWARGSRQIL